jgi:hypothetical protein
LFTTGIKNTNLKVSKSGLPVSFDPKKSKYSGDNELQNLKTKIIRKDAPAYL